MDLTAAHPTIILTTKSSMASYTERMPKEQNLSMPELKLKNNMKEISPSSLKRCTSNGKTLEILAARIILKEEMRDLKMPIENFQHKES